MKIAIAGKKTATENYVRYVDSVGIEPRVTLNLGEINLVLINRGKLQLLLGKIYFLAILLQSNLLLMLIDGTQNSQN